MTPNSDVEQITVDLCRLVETVLSKPQDSVTAQITLQSLGMDSLRLVSLLVAIEQQFEVNLMQSGLQREDLATPATLASRLAACLKS